MRRKVALKLIPMSGDDAEREHLLTRTQREAHISGQFTNHPHVVPVFDVQETTVETPMGDVNCVVIAMTYLDGGSLLDWLREDEHPPSERLSLLLQAADALSLFHGRGLSHRDFKLENGMFDEFGRARVVDFGLARSSYSPEMMSTATDLPAVKPSFAEIAHTVDQGRPVGTLAYMAPEAYEGHADATSDQYSFAVAVWRALTGDLPYDAGEVLPGQTRSRRFMHGWNRIPGGLRRILRRAMAFEPMRRFESMAELEASLKPWVRRLERRQWRQTPQVRRGLVAAAVVASIGLAGGVGYFVAARPARLPVTEAPSAEGEQVAVTSADSADPASGRTKPVSAPAKPAVAETPEPAGGDGPEEELPADPEPTDPPTVAPPSEPVVSSADAALASYRTTMAAYNREDATTYFDGFSDPTCFFRTKYGREGLESKRMKSVLDPGMAIRPIPQVLRATTSEVILFDCGSWNRPGADFKDHRKLIRMSLIDDRWLISGESGLNGTCLVGEKPLLAQHCADVRAGRLESKCRFYCLTTDDFK